jgi:hypothetical protein
VGSAVFTFFGMPFVVAQNAVGRIGKPDRIVGFDHRIVRRIQAVLAESIHQNRDGAVRFSPGHPPRAMFTRDQATLAITGITVAIIGRHPKNADLLPGESEHPVVWDITPQQIISVSEVDRSLGPKAPIVKPFHPTIRQRQIQKTFVVDFKFITQPGSEKHGKKEFRSCRSSGVQNIR